MASGIFYTIYVSNYIYIEEALFPDEFVFSVGSFSVCPLGGGGICIIGNHQSHN
jgi:hypothetical protein